MLNLENSIDLKNQENNFNNINEVLSNIFGNVVNWSIDAAIKYFLPDSIENSIINIKNNLLGDNIQNIIKGNIDNISQTVKANYISEKDQVTDVNKLEKILNNPKTVKALTEIVENVLNEININNKNEKNKNIIYENVEANIDNEIKKQIDSINKIENYKEQWYKNFNEQNFNDMNKVFNNIKKEIKNIIPLENTIKEIRKIENLNELIKKRGGDFNITKEEMELANKLI